MGSGAAMIGAGVGAGATTLVSVPVKKKRAMTRRVIVIIPAIKMSVSFFIGLYPNMSAIRRQNRSGLDDAGVISYAPYDA